MVQEEVKKRSDAYDQQSRYVNGRTFYLNQDVWMDSEIQKLKDAKRVRIEFGSPEYFDLLKKHPEALQWLSLGRNVQITLDGVIYEVHE